MRPPVTGSISRLSSFAITFSVDVFETQPVDNAATPVGQLKVSTATLIDDASRDVARTMTFTVGDLPTWLMPGMWVRANVGIAAKEPVRYRLPVLVITGIARSLSTSTKSTVTAASPAAVVNGRPYEADTTLTGTLQSLVSAVCALALSRPTNVSGVPAVAIPAGTVAEFGTPRWQKCWDVAEALGYALRFTDIGDVIATDRSATPPAPVAVVEHALADAGTANANRVPTAASVLVTRPDAVGLIGHATAQSITGVAPPAWYRPYVVVERREGSTGTTQAGADNLAKQLLRSTLAEADTYDSFPILPAPWLEAGVDVVTYFGTSYGIRAVEFTFPSLATKVTMRRVYT